MKSPHIPTFESMLNVLFTKLKQDFRLSMINIDVSVLEDLQTQFGESALQAGLNSFYALFDEIKGKCVRSDDIITLNIQEGNKFYIFLSKPRNKEFVEIADFEKLINRLESKTYDKLYTSIFPIAKRIPEIKVGYALAYFSNTKRLITILDSLITSSQAIADYRLLTSTIMKRERFYKVLKKSCITTEYIPVCVLKTKDIWGFEALNYGPANSALHNPYYLHQYAEELGLIHDLDWLCRSCAITNAPPEIKDSKIVIRKISMSQHDTELRVRSYLEILKENGFKPQNIIFEIAEQSFIQNQNFYLRLRSLYTKFTLAININDEWKPETLDLLHDFKFEIIIITKELIHGLDTNSVNQVLLYTLIKIAQEIGAQIIAQGIETQQEYETLISMGIRLGQGSYLSHEIQNQELHTADDHTVNKETVTNKESHHKMLVSIYFKRGKDYFDNLKYDNSILEFSKALEIDKNNPDALFYRGNAYYEEGSPIAGLEDIKLVLRINPDCPNALLLKAMILEKLKETTEALATYKLFLKKNPETFQSDSEFANQRIKELSGK